MDTGRGLFGYAMAALQHLWVFVVYKGSKVAAIVENEVQLLAILECGKLLLQTPVVFVFGLAFPSKTRSGLALEES